MQRTKEVSLSQDQIDLLSELAAASGRGIDELVCEAVDDFLAYDRWFREQVQVGMNQLRHGEVVSHSEVLNRITRKLEHSK